jgi:hypothetical protein
MASEYCAGYVIKEEAKWLYNLLLRPEKNQRIRLSLGPEKALLRDLRRHLRYLAKREGFWKA